MILGAALLLLHSTARTAEEPPKTAETVAALAKAWTPLKGKAYMRPLDDGGWKARMTALHNLARAGDKATPPLVAALNQGDDETRVFAAQALSLLPADGAQDALKAALKDLHPAVRLYALGALSMLGKIPKEDSYLMIQMKDTNRDVRANAGYALERDDKADTMAIRQALAFYDLKTMATANIGEKAPDFSLVGADGKRLRLSDYRGKKAVVLVFIYGDT